MSERRENYATGTAGAPACFNCETGTLRLGEFGRYCAECDTYLPTEQAADLAASYFTAMEINDAARAAELRAQLEYCRQETINSVACPRCGGTIGHRINCPDGIAFSERSQ